MFGVAFGRFRVFDLKCEGLINELQLGLLVWGLGPG